MNQFKTKQDGKEKKDAYIGNALGDPQSQTNAIRKNELQKIKEKKEKRYRLEVY